MKTVRIRGEMEKEYDRRIVEAARACISEWDKGGSITEHLFILRDEIRAADKENE